jgi:fumarate reductase (CoM/CoB) subunit A
MDIRHIKTDALILGSGLAGLMAAYRVSEEHGIKVLVLGTGSGASPFVHGFNIPLYKDDSVETFINDTLRSGSLQSDAALVRKLCSESLAVRDELDKLGIELDKKDEGYALLKPLGSSYPRVACSGNETGPAIMKAANAVLRTRKNYRKQSGIRALRLMVEDNRVKGVLAYDEKDNSFVFISARAVVLATGGFCNIYRFSTNTPDIGGDGIAMAYEAGVPLTDMEFIQFEPSAAVYPEELKGRGVITTMFYDGAVLRNARGERFMLSYGSEGERVNKDVMSYRIYEEILKGNGTKNKGVYFDATGVGREKLMESYSSYVKRYERFGIDISREMMEIAPAPHTSLGGVRIDRECRTKVEGLFACGEICGGIHGANRIGGNAGLETLVFGLQAGETARKYIKTAVKEGIPGEGGPDETAYITWAGEVLTGQAAKAKAYGIIDENRLDEIRTRMQDILEEHVNVIRNGDGLKKAKKELSGLLSELSEGAACNNPQSINAPGVYKRMRLYNDVLTAYLAATAALERKESVGCHIRSDSQAKDRSERYRILIEKDCEDVKVSKEPIKQD